MIKTPHDDRLLRSLADAMGTHPRSTLKELAELAGVSKATLHRFCGTRERLIEMLMSHASEVLRTIIEQACLSSGSAIECVQRLIRAHLEQRQTLRFLMFQIQPDMLEDSEEGGQWRPYFDALDAFFLRGQEAGVFRIDVSACAMTEMFTGCVWSVIDAERRGRIARASCAMVIETFFFQGVTSLVFSTAGQPGQTPLEPTVEGARARILLLSDDIAAAELIANYLGMYEFRVEVATLVEASDTLFERSQPALVIVDPPRALSTADVKGLLRTRCTEMSVLILTSQEADQEVPSAIDCGADDYIPKSCEPGLILARVRTLFRRNQPGFDLLSQSDLKVGDLVLLVEERSVTWKGEPVELSSMEFKLLETLVRYGGETLSREELTQRVRGVAFDQDDRSIDVAVSRLRKKFDDPASRPRKITTVWGRGYVLNPKAWA